jgi:hypothetical protein
MPSRVTPEQEAELERQERVAYTPLFLASIEDAAACEAAAISVERIAGPVLLISGEDDQLWPSSPLADMVMMRLRAHGHPYADVHLRYPGAGHLIGVPGLPTTINSRPHPILGKVFDYGGTPREQAYANADSWARVLAFLAEQAM